jgi:hypothetical protein
MRSERETLLTAATSLDLAVSADPPHSTQEWAARVKRALVVLAQVIRREDDTFDSTGGMLAEVGGDLASSGGMDRRLTRLRQGLTGLCAEVEAIRQTLELAIEEGISPRLRDEIRCRSHAVIAGLKRHDQEEGSLLYECATTDIGAGD